MAKSKQKEVERKARTPKASPPSSNGDSDGGQSTMKLIQLGDQLWVPEDFEKNHNYFQDPEGNHEYTGITRITGVLAKENLYEWYARVACLYIMEKAPKSRSKAPKWLVDERFLMEEARTAGFKRRDSAASHGTDAHSMVETYVKNSLEIGGTPSIAVFDETIRPFVEWACENVDHFLFSERRMADPRLFIAGTADFAYVSKDGKRYMADFKTSSGIYGIDYFLQVAGYRVLAEANGDPPYDGSVVVRLGKKGPEDFDVTYRYDYETDRNAFLACLTLYRAQATYKKANKRT